jgi:hypothetical protein
MGTVNIRYLSSELQQKQNRSQSRDLRPSCCVRNASSFSACSIHVKCVCVGTRSAVNAERGLGPPRFMAGGAAGSLRRAVAVLGDDAQRLLPLHYYKRRHHCPNCDALSDNAGAHRVLLVGTVLLLERKQPREKDARREEYSAWNHGAIFAEVVEHERFEARDLHPVHLVDTRLGDAGYADGRVHGGRTISA